MTAEIHAGGKDATRKLAHHAASLEYEQLPPALVELAKQQPRNAGNEITFRDRLAACLNMIGQNVEAEAESRAAVALADKLLAANNLDRAIAHAGLSLEDIAQATGVALETAKTRLRYARAKLRQSLAGERSAHV